jgi:hypothetical protein
MRSRCLLTLALLSLPTMSHAIEEPRYELVRQFEGIEIRDYAAQVTAGVDVAGPAERAGDEGFRVLAAYIFGKNRGETKLAMTAPVMQEPMDADRAARARQGTAAGTFRVQFVLPAALARAAAPVPVDPRVTLRTTAATRLAAIRFSGFWSKANYEEHLGKLHAALRRAGLQPIGAPIYSRYDAPWTPWFMRRNEIWLRLGPESG